MKKIPTPPRSNDSVAVLKSRGPRAKLKPRRAAPFRFSDDQWDPIRDRSGFNEEARKRVEQCITTYRNLRETELLSVPPAETRAELAKLESVAGGLWKQIEQCVGDARAWEIITDHFGWDPVRLYTFQDDIKEFADRIGRARDRINRASPGAATHHNLNMFIDSLISMWEEVHEATFTRTNKRSGPNGLYNGTEFILRVCKIAEPDLEEKTFANTIRYVLEHRAEWQN
jgi:hypothetical protein